MLDRLIAAGPFTQKLYDEVIVTSEVIPLGNCNAAIPTGVELERVKAAKSLLKRYKAICEKKEAGKEPDMNTYDDIQQSRRYLERQICNLNGTTHSELQSKFHINDDDPPTGGKELVDRILAGKYEIPEDKNTAWHYAYHIRWRDPAKKADQEGFDAAWKNFKQAERKTFDAAAVLTPAEGLASLDDLREYADELVHGKKAKK